MINKYMYRLWAFAYIKGKRKEWYKLISKDYKLTTEQKELVSREFTDKLSLEYNCIILAEGCDEIK